MNFQTRSDSQFRFDKCQIPMFLQPFGWIFKPGLITQLRFDKMSNPNFSTTVWMNFQIGFDYPIAIWKDVNSQFFPDHLDEYPNRVWLPNSDLTNCQIPIFPRPFGWIYQTGSDYPIAIWQGVKSQFFPDRLDKFPNRVWSPNCYLIKCQIPNFPDRLDQFPNRVWLSNWDLTSFKSQFFTDRLDEFPNREHVQTRHATLGSPRFSPV